MTLHEQIELELLSFAQNYGKTADGDPRKYADRIIDLAKIAAKIEEKKP